MLCTKKFGRRIGELPKGVGEEASKVGVWKREPVERLRFIDMIAVRQFERSYWRLICRVSILVVVIFEWLLLFVECSRQRKWTRRGRSTRVVTAELRQHFHMTIIDSASPHLDTRLMSS